MRKQMSPELEALLAKAKARVEAMTPEERDAEYAAQRDSWLRGELGQIGDLIETVEWAIGAGIVSPSSVLIARERKRKKLAKYLQHQPATAG